MVNKKSVKMGRDFRFINLRIKHLPCARHENKCCNYSGKQNTSGPALKMLTDSR